MRAPGSRAGPFFGGQSDDSMPPPQTVAAQAALGLHRDRGVVLLHADGTDSRELVHTSLLTRMLLSNGIDSGDRHFWHLRQAPTKP